jgi:hypothetical protein
LIAEFLIILSLMQTTIIVLMPIKVCMKLLAIAFVFISFAGAQSFAAGKAAVPALACRTDAPANFVNTCSPDVVFRVSTQDGTNLDDLSLGSLLPLSLFDTAASKVVKIVTTTAQSSDSIAYFGISKPSVTGGSAKRLMVQLTSWPNSSAVGISQMLSKGSPAKGFTGNVFYNFSPEKNIANTCSVDTLTSTDSLPVLKCPTVSTSTLPNLVISAVAPGEFLALPAPTRGSLGKINKLLNPPTPLFLTGFGVAVNMHLYKALQAANQSMGLIPSSCVSGDWHSPNSVDK